MTEVIDNPVGGVLIAPKKGVNIIRFVSKKTLNELLNYEKENGYQFNRFPCEEIVEQMGDDRFPIINSMIHNGVEMRCFFFVGEDQIQLDMSFEAFFSLETEEEKWPGWEDETDN